MLRDTVAAFASLPIVCAPALAIVGDAQPAEWAIVRPAVMIVSSRSGCSGAILGQDLVLTAAHCVVSTGKMRVAGPGSGWMDVEEFALHPQSSAARRSNIDLALLKLSKPLPMWLVPALVATRPVNVGERLVLVGYGLAVRGNAWTFGSARMATLRVTAYHGNMLAVSDRSAFGEQNKLSACSGDSGGPAYALRSSVPQLVGIIRGSFCGEGATYVTPLAPHRDWIVETARQWHSQLGP